MKIAPNRAVALLTPTVFAPLAGIISVFAADNAGVDVDTADLTAIFIAGATIAFAKAGLWMKGWQSHEAREQSVPEEALEPASELSTLATNDEGPQMAAFGDEADLDAVTPDLPLDPDEDETDLDDSGELTLTGAVTA